MENLLKYARVIPLVLLYIYYRFIKDAFYASILKLGILLVILLISLNIFFYVEHHTQKNKVSGILTLVIIILMIIATLMFGISLILNWD